MKRVGIITRHAVANYGSVLQSYATQKIFEKIDCEPIIIDYVRDDERYNTLLDTYANINPSLKNSQIKRKIYKVMQYHNFKNMYKKFEVYRKKYLKLSEKQYSNKEELKNVVKNENLDVLCTGSDQVWGQIGNDIYDENYFLEFAPPNTKCIAYAASFGKTKISEKLEENINKITEKYSQILVRESTAKEYLNEHGIKNVEHVLDPTLLLSKDEWENIVENPEIQEPYCFVYQLHHNKKFEEYVRYIEKELKIKVYRVNPSIYFAFKPGKFIYLPNIGKVLGLIKNAKFVITDSFHGTVFSMLLNTNFVDFLPNLTSTRITSILKLVGLENRIVQNEKNIDILSDNIDFNSVNMILEKERNKSLDLLRKAIDE